MTPMTTMTPMVASHQWLSAMERQGNPCQPRLNVFDVHPLDCPAALDPPTQPPHPLFFTGSTSIVV